MLDEKVEEKNKPVGPHSELLKHHLVNYSRLSELSFDRKLCWYCGKKDAAEPFGMDSNLNLIYKFHSEKEYCRARSVFKAVRNKAKYPP